MAHTVTAQRSSDLIHHLAAIVGSDQVITSAEVRERYGSCTIPEQRVPSLVVRPASREEIQEIVSLATQYQISLYPISTGLNWGYGSAMPIENGAVVVDLSRMNRIIEVNSTLGYAVIEPGVTQAALHAYLTQHCPSMRLDPTGAGPRASIMGNTLERGVGMGKLGDHFSQVCGLEVVLPNSEVVCTGFLRFPNARARHTYKWGVGPSLDGIFSQSNLGICTKMGLFLERVPPYSEGCYFSTAREDGLAELIDVVRELSLEGIFQSGVNIISRNRILTSKMQYPWKLMDDITPLSSSVSRSLGEQSGVAAWTAMTALEGTPEQVRAIHKIIRRRLSEIGVSVSFVSDSSLKMMERFLPVLRYFMPHKARVVPSLRASFDALRGLPTEMSLRTPYWRHRTLAPPLHDLNPQRDQCGLIWHAPVMPATGSDLVAFETLAAPILERFCLEFCPNYLTVGPRTVICTLPILYNHHDPAESTAAQECYEVLAKRSIAHGFIPYRLGLQSLPSLIDPTNPYWKLIATIKHTLDPAGILSPGHYTPL